MGPGSDITARVKAQYEAFPYPAYSLLLPLRAQEAYASNSLFAARLLEQQGMEPALRAAAPKRVLLAGCGDVLPFMAASWEPRRHRLTAQDLSSASLRRARLRCLIRLRPIDWRQGDLADTGLDLPQDISHIDCYGVLHHLADPAQVLRRFGDLLLPGGTARIMVYNSAARRWLRHLQRAFALLGLSPHRGEDRKRALALLDRLVRVSPALRERLAPMRGQALSHPSRFVDTFLHAREARLDAAWWWRAVEAAGLRIIGLYDRYGELDDLRNPLLEAPALPDLSARIADGRFENNLELYLARPGPRAGKRRSYLGSRLPVPYPARRPPVTWFEYAETRDLPGRARRALWTGFLSALCGRRTGPMDAWVERMRPETAARLGRLGVLMPDDLEDGELRERLRRPIHAAMETPVRAPRGAVRADAALRELVAGLLAGRRRAGDRLELVMARLDAAQGP